MWVNKIRRVAQTVTVLENSPEVILILKVTIDNPNDVKNIDILINIFLS